MKKKTIVAKSKTTRKGKTAAVAPQAAPTTKKQMVIDLLSRDGGATLDEMMQATGWQGHSVRGFVSGTLKKKLGLNVVRKQHEGKSDTYCVSR
jgi:hypothetical protein